MIAATLGRLESGKALLDLYFDIALGKSQETAIVVLRPASRAALCTKDSGLNETVNIGVSELSTCQACVALLDQFRRRDILDSEWSQLRLKDSKNIPLGDEEVVNADRLGLSSGRVAPDADYGLGNPSDSRGMERINTSVE